MVITGFSVSNTVTVRVNSVAKLPWLSVTLYVIIYTAGIAVLTASPPTVTEAVISPSISSVAEIPGSVKVSP